jgi:3-oxoacyl-[acyl-carrier protein] reductase
MDLQLADKTALVLAASRGIGRAVAAALAREGCTVLIASSDRDRIEQARGEIGGRVEAYVIDVRSSGSIAAGAEEILGRHGRVDVLVTNGPGPPPGPAATVSDEDLAAALQANLLSAIQLSRAFLPAMIESGFGRIVNLASSTAREPDEDMVLSNVARAGVLAYAKTLSREVAAHGITVNSILTGSVLTARTEDLTRREAEQAGVAYEQLLEEAAASVPAGYIATPEQFVPAIVFLASPLAQYVNGVALAVDGGYMRSL